MDTKNVIILLAVAVAIIILDFLCLSSVKLQLFSFVREVGNPAPFFIKNGAYFRGFYVFALFVLAYNTVLHQKPKERKEDTKVNIIISTICFLISTGIYVFISFFFEVKVWSFFLVYLAFFILSTIFCVWFVLEATAKTKRSIERTNLSSDLEKIQNKNKTIFSFKTEDGYINVLNPFQGIFVNGGAGAGKSASIAIPIIDQMAKNSWTGLVYDFKFFDLTNVVYTAFKHHPKETKSVKLRIINFTDVQRSHRINPIDPNYLIDEAFIEEYVNTILKNLNKEWIKKSGDFFCTSAILLLKALVLFIKEKHPDICDIPHVFSIVNHFTTEELCLMLSTHEQALSISSSVSEAVQKGAMEQVAGVIATLKAQTQKLDNKNIFWVLGGNDVDLNLNHPETRTVLCVVNDPQKTETLTPVFSLIVTVARKTMNVKDRDKSIFLLDEAPTMFLPNFDELPNTGRSNKICSCYMGQDISQMDKNYGKDIRRNILGSLGNVFYGNATEGETVKYCSELFGKEDVIIENTSYGRNKNTSSIGQSENISFNIQTREVIKPQEIASLPIGTFCGKIVGRVPHSYFKAQFLRLDDQGINPEEFRVPQFTNVTKEMVESFYSSVLEDTKVLKAMYSNIKEESVCY
jgi:hypothetical protein